MHLTYKNTKEEKQAENEAGAEAEKVSTETEKSGQDFPDK